MPYHLEVVVATGLESLAREEVQRLGRGARLAPGQTPGVLTVHYDGSLQRLFTLRLATSVYLVKHFAIPRPRALLGDQHLRTTLGLAETALNLHPRGSFQTLYLSAAGAESSVLTRLKSELSRSLGLQVGPEDGDLLLRLRRGAGGHGWDLLVRLSPRPLATRAWRVCNREGALNGPVAHAMALLTRPEPDDSYLNLGCGSGTLLIERLQIGRVQRAIGCDTNSEALACTRTNLEAAGLIDRCEITPWDARKLPLPDGSVDVITADLPFGHLVGSHNENLELYPALIQEAARVTRPHARCALLSHEVRLMEHLLTTMTTWRLIENLRVDLGGLYPRIFLLRRTNQRV
ncbi:MAG: methyltransferase domain-containing protein [Chloroflexia bacterium]|nr:methyltransferase domain-containing protein [Chloroflexia bacterium]